MSHQDHPHLPQLLASMDDKSAMSHHCPVRVQVSKVAAACGYNPFESAAAEIEEMFINAVYQDQSVLDADSSTLRLSVCSSERKAADALSALACSSSVAQRAIGAQLTP